MILNKLKRVYRGCLVFVHDQKRGGYPSSKYEPHIRNHIGSVINNPPKTLTLRSRSYKWGRQKSKHRFWNTQFNI